MSRILDVIVPNGRGVRVRTVASSAQHLCPVVNEVDIGSLIIEWTTTSVSIELHSLARYIETWAQVTISHEDLVSRVTADLEALCVADVVVTWCGWTAELGIEVRSNAVLR